MPSYAITGTSRGIGLALLENLSSNPENTVIGLVRNVSDMKATIADWKRPNIHVVENDLNNYASLEAAASATSKITGGKLDHLILNAAYLPDSKGDDWSQFFPLSKKGEQPKRLEEELVAHFRTNVVAQIHAINLFMPLILQGTAKKVVMISTGMADAELTRKHNLYENPAYSIGKAAVNMAVAKFSAEYAKDGVHFLSISPGFVDTGHYTEMSEAEGQRMAEMAGRFGAYAPDFAGPITPAESAKEVMRVVNLTSVKEGHGGAFVSHLFPNPSWI